MYITFHQGKLIRLKINGSKTTPLADQPAGQALIEFYNYFKKFEVLPQEQLLTIYDADCAAEKTRLETIIRKAPLVYEAFWKEKIAQMKREISTDDIEQYALQAVISNIQKAYSGLAQCVPYANQGENLQDAFILTEPDFYDPSGVGFTPIQYAMFFANYENQIVQIYDVQSVYEYICLDYYHTFFDPAIKKVALCPHCGKMFRQTRKDQQYCSQRCKEKHINSRNNQNPYHAAYRYLQQYFNRQLNQLRDEKTDNHPDAIAMQQAYNEWQQWARRQVDCAENHPGEDKNAIRKAFIQKLTAKWKDLTKGIKK